MNKDFTSRQMHLIRHCLSHHIVQSTQRRYKRNALEFSSTLIPRASSIPASVLAKFELVFIFIKLQDVDKAIFSEANLAMSPRLIVVKMALNYVNRRIHLSFDVDALDPSVASLPMQMCFEGHDYSPCILSLILRTLTTHGHSTLAYADPLYIVYPVPLGLGI
ncbi:uncharacterized protein F5891DRAFT_1025676 [Suillus fuscotomentosus]|uniref:Uncharacterized protein n=1 Tax=Suillus fuscotomentosus TaxID=1912939 RepID=A0AAD4E9W5_9AGAM|nr:uncharacterized protein F5891DRAFT_1025676 [Suillus fuscotomentosus]KAG1902286.1 hypothetical protein F5891DRAFT_1025676 [Suillus fuscotomentosus]